MSDPRNVPPTRGTRPYVGELPGPAHREAPELHDRHRRAGTRPLSEERTDARIEAVAADLAKTTGSGPYEPPLFRELVALCLHLIHRDLPVETARLATSERDERDEVATRNIATEDRGRLEREARDLRARKLGARRPLLGDVLTRPWMLAVFAVPGAAIDVIGTGPSLEAAFHCSWVIAALFALAMSALITAVAEGTGALIARAGRETRWVAALLAGFLAIAAMVAIGLTIVALTESRAANVAYREGIAPAKVAGEASGGFSGLGEPSSSAPSPTAVAAAPEGGGSGQALKPDLGFFVPLAIVSLLGAALIGFGVEDGKDWHGLKGELSEVEDEVEAAREQENESRVAINEAARPGTEILHRLSEHVELHHTRLQEFLGFFETEYGRLCAVEGLEPRPIVRPAVPTPAEILERLVDPLGAGGDDGAVAPPPAAGPQPAPGASPPPPPAGVGPFAGGPAAAAPTPPRRRPPRRRNPDGTPVGSDSLG
jgi:hypothetical protein